MRGYLLSSSKGGHAMSQHLLLWSLAGEVYGLLDCNHNITVVHLSAQRVDK